MPRHEVVYDPELKETPEFQTLYHKWCRIRKLPHSHEFNYFMDFYEWSMAEGYTSGASLKLLYEDKPYSPENCLWVHRKPESPSWTEEEKEQISRWNKTVNRIRVHYGMEPFEQKGDF